MLKYMIGFIIALISFSTFATIYEQPGQNGPIFSDRPLNSKSEPVSIPPPVILKNNAPPSPIPSSGNGPINEKSATNPSQASTEIIPIPTTDSLKPYITFKILSPQPEESIQNQPQIAVKLEVIPALQAGDKIQIYIDGQAQGEAKAQTDFILPRLDRGTHQISAKLISSSGATIRQTSAITFYVHQAHIGNPVS